jgi:hypothetical protein
LYRFVRSVTNSTARVAAGCEDGKGRQCW